MNGLDIILLLKSGAKLQLFFEMCKCLSNNFLKYFFIPKNSLFQRFNSAKK